MTPEAEAVFDVVTTFSFFGKSFSVPTVVLWVCSGFLIAFPFALRDALRNSSMFNSTESEDDKH